MKRTITLKAEGNNSTAKVTVELYTRPNCLMRDEVNSLALDIADEIMGALGKKYRPSKIRVS